MNRPYIAPKGQTYLQKGLYMNTELTKVIINILIFQLNKKPVILCRLGFMDTKGITAYNVPDGHISLQNHGLPYPDSPLISRGIPNTKTPNIINFRYLKYLSHGTFLIFLEGILYNKSCTNPKGQSHPHTNLPKLAPIIIKNPII